MLFITKKSIDRLAASYKEPDMFTCYANSQSFSSTTSRAILLINYNKLTILFLNLFSTKVVHKVEFDVADLQKHKYKSGDPLASVWSFTTEGKSWRFRIVKKILTLGSMQGDFLKFLKQAILI